MAKLIDITGKAIPGEWGTEDTEGSGIPVLRTTNFTNDGVVDYSDVVTRAITKKSINEKYLRNGDIIIEKSGGSDKQPVGRVIFFRGNEKTYLFNNFTGLLRVKEPSKWYPRYVFYALFANYITGGTRRFENKTTGLHNLKTDDFVTSFDVKDNSLEVQMKICSILDQTKELINKSQKQLIKLDDIIKARFVEMFGDSNNSKDYPIVKVQDVAEIQVGVVIKPAQYYTDAEHGVKAFRSLNIGEITIKDEEWVYFNDEGQKKNSKSILKENDLVIVRSGAPGTACVVTKQFEGSNAVDVIIAHPDMRKVNPYYLCAFTNYPHGKRQIEAGTGGAAQQHFNVGKYKEMDLIYPPKEEQDQFVSFVKQVDKSKIVVQKCLTLERATLW